MTTKTVQLDDLRLELSQPLKNRPDVILIATDDGRRTILGDGYDPFSADEYRQIDGLHNEFPEPDAA